MIWKRPNAPDPRGAASLQEDHVIAAAEVKNLVDIYSQKYVEFLTVDFLTLDYIFCP
jgi:hypothetical protein